MAASILQSFYGRAGRRRMAILTWSRRRPTSSARPTVRFSALHNLPLVLFCRPSSWRDHLEQISAERKVSLNVALEADSLSLQTHIVAEGGMYTLLGPYAITAASKDCRLQSAKLVSPVV